MAAEVGDDQVRNMGTIGGVLAHADPAGDYGTLALMLDATITTNKRTHRRARLLQGPVHHAARADEIVTEVVFPVASGPHKYIKFRRRMFDWAIVGVGAQKMDDGALADRHHQRGADAGPRQRRRAGAGVGRVARRSRRSTPPKGSTRPATCAAARSTRSTWRRF